MTQPPLRPHSYFFHAVIEWIDPDTGERRSHEGEFHQISMGEAGRMMMTQTDGNSLNWSAFESITIQRIQHLVPWRPGA